MHLPQKTLVLLCGLRTKQPTMLFLLSPVIIGTVKSDTIILFIVSPLINRYMMC